MKTFKYNDGEMKIVCPVCNKILLEDKGEDKMGILKICKHVKLIHNQCDGSIHTAKAPFKSSRNGDLDEFKKVARKNKLIVHKY